MADHENEDEILAPLPAEDRRHGTVLVRRSPAVLPNKGRRSVTISEILTRSVEADEQDQDFILVQRPENLVEANRHCNNHMFGFKKWKSHVTARPLEERSEIVKALYSESEKIPENRVATLRPGNVLYVVLFGWWVALVYFLLALLMGITVIGYKYSRFCFHLSWYFLWPFGKFVFLDEPRNKKTQLKTLEEKDQVILDVENQGQNIQPNSLYEDTPLLHSTQAMDSHFHKETKYWKRPSTYLWLILGCPLLVIVHGLVFFASWFLVIFIPVAKVNRKAIKQILLMPPELLHIDESSYKTSHPDSDIVVYMYHALNVYYYKYTVDGMNVIAVNLLLFVILALCIGKIDTENYISSPTTKFILALLAVIPLAYYIGMSITSISAQSSFAVGAVLNATFGSVVEISLYIFALHEGTQMSDSKKCYNELVKSSLVGTLLATMMLIPGLCMIIGGLRHPTQKFNSRSAGVSSTLLFVSVACVFAPTFFSKAYGFLVCNGCVNTTDTLNNTWTLDCQNCTFSVFGMNGDKSFYKKHIQPFEYVCAIILPISYIVGLLYTLKTHRVHVYDTFVAEVPQGHGDHGHSTAHWGRVKSLLILIVSTVLMSLCAELITENIESLFTHSTITVHFMGVTLLALVPDIPEIVNGIQFALNNNINLSIEVGSCIATQVCMLQIPVLVLANVIHDMHFELLFSDIHLVAVVFGVLMMNYVFQDGKSDYFQGSALCLVYVAMIGLYYFAPAPVC